MVFLPLENFFKKKALGKNPEDIIITSLDFNSESKKIVSFCVIQVHFSGELKHEIIKYDCAHGYCHVHRYYWASTKRERLAEELSKDSFDKFRRDIEENWQRYKSLYFERKKE